MKRFALITAAALAVGGFELGCDRDETSSTSTYSNKTATDNKTAGEKVESAGEKASEAVGTAVDKTAEGAKAAGDKLADAANRTGDKIGEVAGDAKEAAAKLGADHGDKRIRDALAGATEAALTEGGLDDVTERLADLDRNRIGKAIKADFPDHTALVKQFRADWKAKYGEDFDINEEKAYPASMFSIKQSEIGAAAPSGTDLATDKVEGNVDKNLEKGRDIATLTIAESHGMAALDVPLIHELPDAWKIDVPDTIDAAKLKDNIVKHLTEVHNMKAQWPDNVQDAYAAVTHHVLMALLDQPVK